MSRQFCRGINLSHFVDALALLCRWFYWTDYGSDTIERASMDGSSRTILHSTNLVNTYAITMDYENQTLYWADNSLNKIESSSVDGSNRRTLTASVNDPYSMAYHNGKLYWGDNGFNRILTGTVAAPGSGTYLGGGVSYDVYGIHVVSKETQPSGIRMHAHDIVDFLFNFTILLSSKPLLEKQWQLYSFMSIEFHNCTRLQL